MANNNLTQTQQEQLQKVNERLSQFEQQRSTQRQKLVQDVLAERNTQRNRNNVKQATTLNDLTTSANRQDRLAASRVQKFDQQTRRNLKDLRKTAQDQAFGRNKNILGNEVRQETQARANTRRAERISAVKSRSSAKLTNKERSFIQENISFLESTGQQEDKTRAQTLQANLAKANARTSTNEASRANRFNQSTELGRRELRARASARATNQDPTKAALLLRRRVRGEGLGETSNLVNQNIIDPRSTATQFSQQVQKRRARQNIRAQFQDQLNQTNSGSAFDARISNFDFGFTTQKNINQGNLPNQNGRKSKRTNSQNSTNNQLDNNNNLGNGSNGSSPSQLSGDDLLTSTNSLRPGSRNTLSSNTNSKETSSLKRIEEAPKGDFLDQAKRRVRAAKGNPVQFSSAVPLSKVGKQLALGLVENTISATQGAKDLVASPIQTTRKVVRGAASFVSNPRPALQALGRNLVSDPIGAGAKTITELTLGAGAGRVAGAGASRVREVVSPVRVQTVSLQQGVRARRADVVEDVVSGRVLATQGRSEVAADVGLVRRSRPLNDKVNTVRTESGALVTVNRGDRVQSFQARSTGRGLATDSRFTDFVRTEVAREGSNRVISRNRNVITGVVRDTGDGSRRSLSAEFNDDASRLTGVSAGFERETPIGTLNDVSVSSLDSGGVSFRGGSVGDVANQFTRVQPRKANRITGNVAGGSTTQSTRVVASQDAATQLSDLVKRSVQQTNTVRAKATSTRAGAGASVVNVNAQSSQTPASVVVPQVKVTSKGVTVTPPKQKKNQVQVAGVSTTPRSRSATATGLAQVSGSGTKQNTKQDSDQDVVAATRTSQTQQQLTVQQTAQSAAVATPVVSFVPNRLNTPPVKLRRAPELKRRRQQGLASFDVLVRRGGKFRRVNNAGLTFGDALRLGRSSVGSTSSASFKLVNRSGGVVDVSKGLARLGPSFRLSKRDSSVFVERSGFRINTPGELSEITFKEKKRRKKNASKKKRKRKVPVKGKKRSKKSGKK